MNSEARIVIMAKLPARGTVKTRLAPALDEDARLALYEAMLRDKIEAVRSVRGARAVIAVAPPESPTDFQRWLNDDLRDVPLVAQRGPDLGARLEALAADHFAEHHAPILIVDSDTPSLPARIFEEAVAALERDVADVVLGPAADGGYTMIGLARHVPALFEDIPWSTSRVLSKTITRARAAGLRVHFVQSWHDVDTPADLGRLVRELGARSIAEPGYPAHTATALRAMGLFDAKNDGARNEHWSTLASKRVYENRWLTVTENVVALPNGGHTLYGVVATGPCVGVVPMVDDDHVLLVRQFRYVAQRFTWEVPTGGVHEGESIEDAARRELEEEAGHRAGDLRPLVSFHPSKSVLDETAHMFVARALTPTRATPDETEELAVRAFPLDEARAMVARGEIVDSMTMVGILLASSPRT